MQSLEEAILPAGKAGGLHNGLFKEGALDDMRNFAWYVQCDLLVMLGLMRVKS